MRATLCVLLTAACVLADESRGSKRPYIADAVGNTLPPPSNGPATVGSPVNLLTPDRYEFYTFDESGELVKRLMTLQEIQAIVAAGEEAEGLVTFANDNQPTIAFNFSQPPYTKVHSVVTNVQNVLKAQMEAQKNKPHINPTLDTPDVSDSWSLILPSIFGNTGVDIVPDKISGSFSTPETETIEFDRINFDENLSKEGSNPIVSSTTVQHDAKPTIPERILSTTELTKEVTTTSKPVPKSTTTSTTTTTTTTTPKTTTTTTPKTTTTSTTTTTKKPTTTSTTTTTAKPRTTTTTTPKPTTTSTSRPRTTSTTRKTTTTTFKPRTTSTATKNTTTTNVITTTKPPAKITSKSTTVKPLSTTKRISTSTPKSTETQSTKLQTISRGTSTTEKNSPIYEKVSTFVPVSTIAYITEKSTRKPIQSTKFATTLENTTKKPISSTSKVQSATTLAANVHPTITTYKPTTSTTTPASSTIKNEESNKDDASTITTQSVSPSTVISSTEFMSIENKPSNIGNVNYPTTEDSNDNKDNEANIHLFDVAQSISQIASDLGSTNYQPIPTTSDLLHATNAMNMDLESKESLELDIPSDSKIDADSKTSNNNKDNDNFVKISTIHPHPENINKNSPQKETLDKGSNHIDETTPISESTTTTSTETPMDPILSESMDDLLSQVVNQAPQSIVGNENRFKDTNEISTTDNVLGTSTLTATSHLITTAKYSEKVDSSSTTEMVPVTEKSHRNAVNTLTNLTQDNIQHNKDKETESKKEEIDNFVKISSLAQNETSKVTSEIYDKLSKPVELLNATKEIQTLSADKENNMVAVINVPESIKKENVPSSTEMPPKHEILHKTTSEDIKKLSDEVKDDTDDIKVSLPKADDFKKKIQKVNIDYKEIANERNNSWKLISTVSPPKVNEIPKDKFKTDLPHQENPDKDIVLDVSKENQGLEVTTKDLGEDIAEFTELCNELAFRYWSAIVENIQNKRSFVLSPFSITSMLAMMFMGARGATSGEMNEILKLDDMVTFNPHFTLKNISDSIETTPESGVAISAFIRELYSDRNKGKILTFYKERAQHFYNGHVEEVNFKLISDIIRRRTNLLVKRYTWGKIIEYMKANTITMQPPLAAFSTNIFQTDCTGSSVEGRDGEMYFVVSPNVRQRRLVPVPAVLYKKGFLAGYDPVLDATAAALGNTNSIISTLFLMPGQQGNVVHAEDLEALEKRLLDSNPSTPGWNRLLRTLLPRIGLELQIPRFSHKSIFNVSSTLKKMGLKDLFDADHADLGGLNGPSKDLYLSDMIQTTTFVTCGEGIIGEQHHIEEYPDSIELARRRRTSRWASGWDEPRDYQRAFHDPHDVGDAMNLPLHLRPRQARLPARNSQPARLKFDRPFLYFVRHNPSGMILYVGRYNPRLLP